jgi:hypothetical protein
VLAIPSGDAAWVRDLAALVGGLRARCGEVPVVLAAVPPLGSFPALRHPLMKNRPAEDH